MKLYFTFLILTIYFNSFSQNHLSIREVDSLYINDNKMQKKLDMYYYFNYFLSKIKNEDTLILNKINGKYVFTYKGDAVLLNDTIEHKIQIEFDNDPHREFYFMANIRKNELEKHRVTVLNEEGCIRKMKSINYFDEVMIGDYREDCLISGDFTTGKYMQIDSFYNDSLTFFNEETYELILRISRRNKFPKKCGTWTYKINGILRKEEYIPCK